MILLREGFPVNVLNQVKQVPEVCTIYCATANPVGVLIAETDTGARGVAGVIVATAPRRSASRATPTRRPAMFLRAIGYKL